MILGMDFGTTNSGMAVYDGRSVSILPLDPSSPNPRVARTAVYITNEQAIHIGRAAIDRYYTQNIDRPIKIRKVWVGEIDVYAEDMHYVTDAYVYVDVLSPGRLFLSIKSSLREADYPGTVVGQFYYSLEKLIALYLSTTKIRAEKLLGQPVNQVVLGRPVRFAHEPDKDRLAQSRLLQAAFLAGYEKVYLQYEPIAAAYSYETTLTQPQNVLIFDFGGGTLDLTVMRLGERPRQVLATGGIPVAGDVFDQKLVRAKLPRHFGEGTYYGPRHKALTIPRWIFDSFRDWQKLMELQAPENKRVLRDIARTAQRRWQIEALEALVSSNYGLKMFDIVEQAKRRLSEKRGAEILLQTDQFNIREFVTRTEFEAIIRAEINAIDTHIDETVRASGLRPEQIDAVIRTGGSSQIPVFDAMLRQKFGAEKVQAVDIFSSVTAGLGVMGHEIAQGTLETKGYTPADVVYETKMPEVQSHVTPVNLDLIQRRLAIAEGQTDVTVAEETLALVALGEDGWPVVGSVPEELRPDTAVSLAASGIKQPVRQLMTANWDMPLLLLTNRYRFLLYTPRRLQEMAAMGVSIADEHRLDRLEVVTAAADWHAIRQCEKLLLVTSLGVVRPYPLSVMLENIEAPVPLRFDNPLPGEVVALFGVSGTEEVVLGTASGKGVRWPLRRVRTIGVQAINLGTGDDRVVTAVTCQPDDDLLLVTADGYGRVSAARWIDTPAKPNQKGKSLIARRTPLVAIVPAGQPAWLAASPNVYPLQLEGVLREASTKSVPVAELPKGVLGTAVLSGSAWYS